MTEIVLVRHGRPALSRKVRLTASGYAEWWARYDTVGLNPGQTPPARIRDIMSEARVVASSTLPRARESATLAAGVRPDVLLPEMVEAPLPPPGLGPWKMSPIAWGTLSRIGWMAGHSAGGESAGRARLRAQDAATRLETLSREGRTVVFGHGWFNRMVGRALRQRGWTCVEGRGDAYWSHRVFARALPQTVDGGSSAQIHSVPTSPSRVSQL